MTYLRLACAVQGDEPPAMVYFGGQEVLIEQGSLRLWRNGLEDHWLRWPRRNL
jgi:hypothetical protein